MARHSVSQRLFQLAAAEERFLQSEFLAPVTAGGGLVRVRIAGIVCEMQIEPADFRGWGVFRPADLSRAQYVREATLTEQQRYLQLFPRVSLVLCERRAVSNRETIWLALTAHRGDARFQIDGLVPVRMVEEAEPFDTIQARFDGANFWFESIDPVRDPAAGDFLRRELREMKPPNELKRKGLTPEERAAYTLSWNSRQVKDKPERKDAAETRLRKALAHAGAEFVDYLERGDGYRVTYRVGRRTMVTSVDKQNLSVQVAGICLSGKDRDFDLESLIGVLREGGGGTVAIGQGNRGMAEADYFSMYQD